MGSGGSTAKNGDNNNNGDANIKNNVKGDDDVNNNNTKKEEPKSPDVQKNGAMREPELSQSNDIVEKTSTNNLNNEKNNVKQKEEEKKIENITSKNNNNNNNNTTKNINDSTATTTTTDIDDDPLNQTIGKSNTGIKATTTVKPKERKNKMSDPTFEISLEDLTMKERIGEGGFSTVHKAVLKKNRATVAVKILKQQGPSEKTLESFAKEIWMHSQIRHPHVLQFFGGCTEVPKLCLVTEYMFCSLQTALDHDPGAFHPQAEVEIATCVALGLNHLHILNIMHRDLKASNVLLDKNYCNPKICDFGLAKMKKETETLTRGVGSPFAMAPEVFTSSRYDKPVDWYAFGVLVWQLVTKKHPYKGMKYNEVVNHVVKDNKRLEIPNDTHDLVKGLMKQCWDKDPDLRPKFNDVMEILEELSETLEGSMLTAMTQETVKEEFPSRNNITDSYIESDVTDGNNKNKQSPRKDAVEFAEDDFLSQTLSWDDIVNLEQKINMKDMELELIKLRRELDEARRRASQDMAVQHHRSMQSKEKIMEEHEDELRHLETSILQERMRQKIKLRKRLKAQKNKQTRPDITYALSLLNNPPKELTKGGGDKKKEGTTSDDNTTNFNLHDLSDSAEMI